QDLAYRNRYERKRKTFRMLLAGYRKKVGYALQRSFANLRHIAESLQPLEFALPAKPGDLALRVVPRVALRVEDRIAQVEFTLDELHRLLVSVRLEGLARGRKSERKYVPHLFHQSMLEHPGATRIQS